MRKGFAVLLGVIALGVLWCVPAFAAYYDEGNDGDSWETAYVIDSVEDFMLMRERSSVRSDRYSDGSKYYKLTVDLDLSAESDMNDATSFYGHLDGQNHTVKVNITHTQSIGSTAAIFAVVSTDNVAIRNLKVTGSVRDEDSSQAAGIVLALQSGTIENCSFTGTVEGRDAVGGIVGHITPSAFASSENKAVVKNCTFSGKINVSGETSANAGGIVALLADGHIENCTTSEGVIINCNVQQSTQNMYPGYIGGIAGMGTAVFSTSSITNCTSHAVLEGQASWKGGIIGVSDSKVNLSGNTWPPQYPEAGSGSTTPDPVSYDQPTTSQLPPGTIQPVELAPDILEKAAQAVNVDVSRLNILTSANITPQQEPTQTMLEYVKNDGSELVGKLNTLSVDQEGWYVFKIKFDDELYGLLKDKNISDYKFYGLNESDASAPIVSELLNAWEILNMTGDKITSFESRELLMDGFLKEGQPFSLYLAKPSPLETGSSGGSGGCTSTLNLAGFAVLVLLLAARKQS